MSCPSTARPGAEGQGRPNKGFVIYGPDGNAMRRWDTNSGDHDDSDDEPGSCPEDPAGEIPGSQKLGK
jgi:hypothetical protein